VFPARRYLQGIAEAAACGASMVVKGTEFVDRGSFTLLTAPQFKHTRIEVGYYHGWIEEHAHLYANRTNLAPVALLYPGDRLWQDWDCLAPLFFGAGQALLAAGIPWTVVNPGEELSPALQALLVFDDKQNTPFFAQSYLPIISIPSLPAWSNSKASRKSSKSLLSAAAGAVIDWGYHAYFSSRFARSLMDRAGVMRLFTGSPLFNLPTPQQQAALNAALPDRLFPRLHTRAPVLIECWEHDGDQQVHLVNYASHPQTIRIDFDTAQPRRMISPDAADLVLPESTSVRLDLEIYSVITTQQFDKPF
jgi:hypothetical protein